tara:strand:+ start:420 stop:764 length:345 start_codon:yes stop_codon:yes gene_type:complete
MAFKQKQPIFKNKHDGKAKTGHGAKGGPDVYYTKDGKSKQVANIDEENLENKVRKDLVFGSYVVHTNPDTNKKTKYYFKNPKIGKKKYPDSYTKEDIEFLKEQREDIVREEDKN